MEMGLCGEVVLNAGGWGGAVRGGHGGMMGGAENYCFKTELLTVPSINS